MRMNVDGGGAATEGPATFVLRAISDLRASGSGKSGRLRPMPQTGPAPCSGHAKAHPDQIDSVFEETEPGCALDSMRLSHFLRRTGAHFGGKCSSAAGEPAEEPSDMRALREEVENLRGEVRRLTRLVALTRTRNEREPRKPAAAELRRATMGHERATERFNDAASHLVRTVSGAEASRDWERTDEAVAGLIVALSKQIPLRRELAGARGAAANRVRHIRALERAEKERRAIRRLLARRWWKFGLG